MASFMHSLHAGEYKRFILGFSNPGKLLGFEEQILKRRIPNPKPNV